MFYVTHEPDGKFLYTETVKLYIAFTLWWLSGLSAKSAGGSLLLNRHAPCVCGLE